MEKSKKERRSGADRIEHVPCTSCTRGKEKTKVSIRSKRARLFLFFFLCASFSYAQTNTNLGTNSGNAGVGNTSVGYYAGDLVTGTDNSFFGRNSGTVGTSGNYNSYFGAFTGNLTTTGSSNTFLGYSAGYSLTTGSNNVLVGRASGYATTGSNNTFVGYYSGRLNTSGHDNVAVGTNAFFTNTTGFWNTAFGVEALYTNTGDANNAMGYKALELNTTGASNNAMGYHALDQNTTGSYNVGLGNYALTGVTTGNHNIGIGHSSSAGNEYSIAIGYLSSAGGDNSIAIGKFAATTAANQIRLGNSAIGSIGGYQPWTNVSDGRFKKELREDVPGLDFINKLRPVSYVLDRESLDSFLGIPDSVRDKTFGIPDRQTGFIAQEVEQIINQEKFVFSGVDGPKNEKDPYGIRYSQFVVPLVKAVQELSAKVEEQQKLISALLEQKSENGRVNTTESASEGAALFQNNPNPFSNETEIKMQVPETTTQANIIVYNLAGSQLKSVPVSGRGQTAITISAGELNPGMYIYVLMVDGRLVDSKRMILTK